MNKKRALIVGMGFGHLYANIYRQLGYEVVTVDPSSNKNATYPTVESIPEDMIFSTAHICTPNHTHAQIAERIAHRCCIVFIEKPGVVDKATWTRLVNDFPLTRFMMTKNNQYRSNITAMAEAYKSAKQIKLHWINHNRVPSAGSWFTTKDLAFGGVSRDLLPHLLSIYTALEPDWKTTKWSDITVKHRWQLSDLTSTDYGSVNENGTYDVDDFVKLTTATTKKWEIIADWKSNDSDDIGIYFDDQFVPLGLCPEEAYKTMILEAISQYQNPMFWQEQYDQDCWIHDTITL